MAQAGFVEGRIGEIDKTPKIGATVMIKAGATFSTIFEEADPNGEWWRVKDPTRNRSITVPVGVEVHFRLEETEQKGQ